MADENYVNESVVHRGTGGARFWAFEVTNLADLEADHPLKTDGLQTSGYFIVLKIAQEKAFDNPELTKTNQSGSGITVVSKTKLYVGVLPQETLGLQKSKYYYCLEMANSLTNPTEAFLLESGYFNAKGPC
jgi:hypothetical protein